MDKFAEAGGSKASDREQMLLGGAVLWTVSGLGIFFAGTVVPSLAPEVNAWAYKLGFSAWAIFVVASYLTWMQKLDDQRLYWLVNFFCVTCAAIPCWLMLVNPLSIGPLSISLLAQAVFAAQFLRARATIFQIAVLTAAVLIPIAVHAGDISGDHLMSRVAAFLPIMWAVAAAVWMLRHNRLRAIADADVFAKSDPLTGLANLRAFRLHAEELLGERNKRLNGATGLLLIDLDDFKSANTLYGHAGGDHLLAVVGNSLRRAASHDHLVARIGGDEFAVLLTDVRAEDMEGQAGRYRNAVCAAQKEIEMPGIELDASIGTAVSGLDGEDLESLLTAADRSMYAVKASAEKTAKALRRAQEMAQVEPSAMRRAEALWVGADESRGRAPEAEPKGRPENAKFAAGAWVLGVTIGLFSLTMPDADLTQGRQALIALLIGYVVSVIAYFTAPTVESGRHTFNDVFTMCSIGFISYLTGGADSPLWPLIFLLIVYDAWFLGWRRMAFRIVGTSTVILAPLVYQPWSEIGAVNATAMYSGVLTAIGVIWLVSWNQVNMIVAQKTAKEAAAVDMRTGLANRRAFEKQVEEIFAAHVAEPSAEGVPAIVMIDLDNFKDVNTEHGHAAGDDLLSGIANALAARTRGEDCIARVGGDEFAVVIPAADVAGAQSVAQRYVDAVGELTSHSDLAACRKVTASAGFALYGVNGESFDDVINAADVALMNVKTSRGVGTHSGGIVVAAAGAQQA